MNIPQVIRICEHPGHIYSTVITYVDGVTIKWVFQAYEQYPDGSTYVTHTDEFFVERQAVDFWSRWGSERPWHDDTPAGMCRSWIDQNT